MPGISAGAISPSFSSDDDEGFVSQLSVAPSSVWTLDEASGVTAVDVIGGINGTHGAAVTPGVAGQIDLAANYVASVNSYTTVGDTYTIERTQPFSVSYWLRTSSPGNQTGFGRWDPAYRGYRVAVAQGSGVAVVEHLFMANSGINRLIVRRAGTTNSISDGNWHHVVVTYNGNSASAGAGVAFYRDGVAQVTQVFENTLSATILTAGADTMLAGEGTAGASANQMVGDLDDMGFFLGELTAADVTLIYNAGLAGTSVALV